MRRLMVTLSILVLSALTWAQRDATQQIQAVLTSQLQTEIPGVQVYAENGTLQRIWGVPFSYGSSPADAAQAFLANYRTLFTLGTSELVLSGTQEVMPPKFTAVYFQQRVQGIPVDRGELTLLVRNEPNFPLVLASNAVRFVEPIDTTPNLTANQAVETVRFLRPDLHLESQPELVVYPSDERTHLAWALIVDSRRLEQPERYRVFIDAHTGAPLEWRSLVYFADVRGRVLGYATPGLRPDHYQNPPRLTPLAGLVVEGHVIHDGPHYVTQTDRNGFFSFPNIVFAYIFFEDFRKSCMILDYFDEHLAIIGEWVENGTVLVFNENRAEMGTSQVNCHVHTDLAIKFASEINPRYPSLSRQLFCVVNIPVGCNAYYSNQTLLFHKSYGTCPNTAYSTVIYHEFGHFLVDMAHPNATLDYHEAMADTTSMMITGDPCIALELRGIGTGCLRNPGVGNNWRHPCTSTNYYDCSMVLSGAFWQTYQRMLQRYSSNPTFALQKVREWYLNSILLRPSGISPAIAIDLLILDDNDGCLFNGTPHFREITQGFAHHGLWSDEMWRELSQYVIANFTIAPNSVVGGNSSEGTVHLSCPAPAGGLIVQLSSSNTNAATVPASVTVAAGQRTATFTITTRPVASQTQATITARLGNSSRQATLTVNPPTLESLTLNPSTVVGGNSSTGTVSLNAPAPAGGAVVRLSSSNTNVATVPTSVTIPAGQTRATFTIRTNRPSSSGTRVTITATYNSTSRSARLTVNR